jgi:hypothetical protein
MKRMLSLLAFILAFSAYGDDSLLHQLAQQLPSSPNGTMWSLTTGNKLEPGFWLSATSATIGADRLAQDIGHLIGRAEKRVDIVTMAPLSEKGLFADHIRAGIQELVTKKRKVTVRILLGNGLTNTNTRAFLDTLAPIVKGSEVNVIMGAVSTCIPGAWSDCNAYASLSTNHAKIVAMDGKEAIVGGHNLWPGDYANPRPIYDLTMHVIGPAAQAAVNFAAPLWKHTCTYSWHETLGTSKTYADTLIGATGERWPVCAYYEPETPAAGDGTIDVMGIGRAGLGLISIQSPLTPEFQWSDRAMQFLFDKATTTIRLSQQDLVSRNGNANRPVLEALAKSITRGVDVYVIMTNKGATSDSGASYYEGYDALDTARSLHSEVARVSGKSKAEVRDQVCKQLHLGSIARRGADGVDTNRWAQTNRLLGNHAKVYIVDDRYFYIGSHNVYPMTLFENIKDLQVSNQEYGFIVDDPASAKVLLNDYWNPIWTPTSSFAVSGDLSRCKL